MQETKGAVGRSAYVKGSEHLEQSRGVASGATPTAFRRANRRRGYGSHGSQFS